MPVWEQWQVELVERNFERLQHRELAELTGRSVGAVRNLCSLRGLRKKAPDWTEEQINVLREHYAGEHIRLEVLARIFERDISNISRKARELGLTDQRRKVHPAQLEKMRQNGLARAAAGYRLPSTKGLFASVETRAKLGLASRRAWSNPVSRFNSEEFRQKKSDDTQRRNLQGAFGRQRFSKGKMGKRADLGGLYVRSSWEANYARFLNWQLAQGKIQGWKYEPDTFVFESIKRGQRSYTPDFKVYLTSGAVEYHEVKGWMTQQSAVKLRRMAKFYPEVTVVLIDRKAYREIQKFSRLIPGWEVEVKGNER